MPAHPNMQGTSAAGRRKNPRIPLSNRAFISFALAWSHSATAESNASTDAIQYAGTVCDEAGESPHTVLLRPDMEEVTRQAKLSSAVDSSYFGPESVVSGKQDCAAGSPQRHCCPRRVRDGRRAPAPRSLFNAVDQSDERHLGHSGGLPQRGGLGRCHYLRRRKRLLYAGQAPNKGPAG